MTDRPVPDRPMRDRPVSDRPPQRLSPLTPLVRSFIVLLAAATTVVRDVTRGEIGPTATLFGLLLIAGAVYGMVSWLRTTFWIEYDELRVDTGVLNRQSRRIRIDRLQGIDIVQPFVARLFGLAELRMDVAGGNAREGSLAYLPLSEAHRLRDLLLARRDELGSRRAAPAVGEAPQAASGVGEAPQAAQAVGEVPQAPQAAPAGGPAVPGVTGPGATGAGVTGPGVTGPGTGAVQPDPSTAAAGPAPMTPVTPARPMAVPLERPLARVDFSMLVLSILLSAETITMVLVSVAMFAAFAASGEWLGVSATLPVLFGFGVALFRRFSANYRFTVSDTAAGMQVRRGLFELSAQTIALQRVQGVVVTEPLLWRRLGWARLDVSIAGYGTGIDDDRAAPSTVLPVGDRRLVHELARHVLRGLDPEGVVLRPVPRRARWAAPVAHRFMRVGTDERLVVSREGWLARRTHAAPQERIQSVRITQGPWQRRLGLADVHTDSPPGPTTVRARHRDAAEARRLFDVEVATTAWARRTTSPEGPRGL